jgi:hypothetical protein
MVMHRIYLIGMVTVVALGTPAMAAETPFTPEAAAAWSERSLRMAKVVDLAFGESITRDSFSAACQGLTGEQMKHEYGKEPRWALSAQIRICSAYDGWARKFQGNKAPCAALKKGMGDLDKGRESVNPEEVVLAANALQNAAARILASAQSNHAC